MKNKATPPNFSESCQCSRHVGVHHMLVVQLGLQPCVCTEPNIPRPHILHRRGKTFLSPPGQKLIVRSERAHYSLDAMLGGFHSRACVCCLLFSKAACPVLCSGNGQYLKGRCMCHSGWKGSECDVPTNQCIDVTCSSHGTCIVGTCICNPGYKGENCEEGDVAQKWAENPACLNFPKCL